MSELQKKSSHDDDRAVIILQVLSHRSTLTGEFPRFLHSLNPAVSAGQRHVTPGPVRQGLFGESNKVYKCFIKFCGQFRGNMSKCSKCSKKYRIFFIVIGLKIKQKLCNKYLFLVKWKNTGRIEHILC